MYVDSYLLPITLLETLESGNCQSVEDYDINVKYITRVRYSNNACFPAISASPLQSPIHPSIYPTINPSIHQSINHSINQSSNQSMPHCPLLIPAVDFCDSAALYKLMGSACRHTLPTLLLSSCRRVVVAGTQATSSIKDMRWRVISNIRVLINV